ncbi:MAG: hypothetical protein KJ737_01435 [Proteobacteria bacterium]|nr:hypothetical protein [Pseudomonadota bacterium]
MKKKTAQTKSEMKEREEAFKSLPPNIRQSLTEDEIHAFLHEDAWTETLFEKLKDFIVPDNSK